MTLTPMIPYLTLKTPLLQRKSATPPALTCPLTSSDRTTDTFTEVHTSTTTSTPFALLLGHTQVCEYPISIFDEGMAKGTFTTQNYGPDLTQSQLVRSHLHLPQFDWGYHEEPLLPYNNQAIIPVSIIVHP